MIKKKKKNERNAGGGRQPVALQVCLFAIWGGQINHPNSHMEVISTTYLHMCAFCELGN
jgi:hypothetical protein